MTIAPDTTIIAGYYPDTAVVIGGGPQRAVVIGMPSGPDRVAIPSEQGPPGPQGGSFLSTSGPPSNAAGTVGSLAIDPVTGLIYGPKTTAGWPLFPLGQIDIGTSGSGDLLLLL